LSSPNSVSEKPLRVLRSVITIAVAILPVVQPALAGQRKSLIDTSPGDQRQHVTATIIARGHHVSGSMGSTDSFVALISTHKDQEPVATRLVLNYGAREHIASDESIRSHPQFRLYVVEEPLCSMDATAFVPTRVFDTDAMAKVQGYLPCAVVQQ
jgi:hypothetical protein